MKFLTRTIWILSLVSLFTDLASEMLYPVLPVYLQSIGYSILIIGIIEGIAEAVAGLSKGYFGNLSDATGKRVPFVRVGYMLSAISKPLMGLLTNAWWILAARTTDRIGKGVRTSARDAILSDESHQSNKGKVFGFHRAMDTTGAVLGPAAALVYLYYYPEHYTQLFLIAFIPGLLAVVCTYLLKEKKETPKSSKYPGFFSFVQYFKQGPAAYKKLVTGLLVFALVNSSDVFLLLKMKESGASDTHVIGIYIFYNIIYALFAFPAGYLADKIGLKKMLSLGILLFSVVYLTVSVAENYYLFLFLFALYGMYAAATEGIAKALISNLCIPGETATAIGTYSAFQSVCALIASVLAGWVWYTFGSDVVFIYAGVVSLGVAVYLRFRV